MKVIDVHAHVFPANIAEKAVGHLESYYECKWDGTGLEQDLVSSVLSAKVESCVIFSSATKEAQVRNINNYIASLQNKYPHLFIGFGTMHMDFTDYAAELDRIRLLGLKGLKFHTDFQGFYVDDPKMMPIYEAAGKDLPMLFHIGDRKSPLSSPDRLRKVVRNFPGYKIIAAHMGGYSVWEEAWKYLIGMDVFMDISSTIRYIGKEKTKKMVLAHGPEKVLFASDYPALRHKDAIEDVLSLDLGDEINEMIFHENAERVLGLA
ncbi:MAG: amidohydrolase family protein [Lentisphaeria bacterium]|nr:amidohydrolase family protein [Lentisphaeria bacterium]